MPCGAVHVQEFVGGGRGLRYLVVAPPSGEPGEPQRQAGIVGEPAPSGGVVRQRGDLGGEHLQYRTRLEPHVGALPRAPAWYPAVGASDLHTSPSQPSATARSKTASSALTSPTCSAVVRCSRADGVMAAASRSRRRGYSRRVRSSPSA